MARYDFLLKDPVFEYFGGWLSAKIQTGKAKWDAGNIFLDFL